MNKEKFELHEQIIHNMKTHIKQQYLPLVALCLGFFMVIIDVTIVNVALPIMSKKLHGDISWLQWVVDGYTLTFACLLLSAGHFADRIGARSAFITGQVLFVMTSIGCGLSFNFLQLTIFRLLQGASAALLVPTSLALINAAYKKKEERANAIGIWATMGGVAAAAGPILGGILTEWLGWRFIFFVNIPVGLACETEDFIFKYKQFNGYVENSIPEKTIVAKDRKNLNSHSLSRGTRTPASDFAMADDLILSRISQPHRFANKKPVRKELNPILIREAKLSINSFKNVLLKSTVISKAKVKDFEMIPARSSTERPIKKVKTRTKLKKNLNDYRQNIIFFCQNSNSNNYYRICDSRSKK